MSVPALALSEAPAAPPSCAPTRVLQRGERAAGPVQPVGALGAALASRAEPLDSSTRDLASKRLGYDFSSVRVHRDPAATGSAAGLGALGYAVGPHVVFAPGRYAPGTPEGRGLIVHELAHVVQQHGGHVPAPEPMLQPLGGGGVRLAVAPAHVRSTDPLERAAEYAGAETAVSPAPARPASALRSLGSEPTAAQVQQAQLPLPRPIPMCGRMLTHVDVKPPRWRDLEPCKPKGFPVFRINIVGRDLSRPPARPQVFNLHVGAYRDPATGRWCGIAHDSKACLPGAHCRELGCFPTLREVLDAIREFVRTLLEFIGILLLLALLALLVALFWEILVPAAGGAAALAEGGEGGSGGDAGGSDAGPVAVAAGGPAESGGEPEA